MTIEEKHTKIWNHINKLKTGMLCTSSSGLMSSRPMSLVQSSYEGKIYLFASADAHKVADIRKSPQVNMNFTNGKDSSYLSLSGIASIEENGSLFDNFWSDDIKIWFEGHSDPKASAVLIVIDVTHADIWETQGNKFTRILEFTKAKVTDSKPEVGQHETLAQ
jgi:general stress protein 26